MSDLPEEVRKERDKWRNFPRQRPTEIVEPGPDQESVWNYPRPPKVEPVPQRVRVEFNGVTLADTTQAYRVCETASPPAYYLPPADVNSEYLERSSHKTMCEWKGTARYWNVRVGERTAENAVWAYLHPWEGFADIKGYFAFNASLMDACYVGDWLVTPQPGHFYGGWITPNVVGPFKGEPGTGHW